MFLTSGTCCHGSLSISHLSFNFYISNSWIIFPTLFLSLFVDALVGGGNWLISFVTFFLSYLSSFFSLFSVWCGLLWDGTWMGFSWNWIDKLGWNVRKLDIFRTTVCLVWCLPSLSSCSDSINSLEFKCCGYAMALFDSKNLETSHLENCKTPQILINNQRSSSNDYLKEAFFEGYLVISL